MTIEWDETVETKRRVRMLVDGRGSPSAPAAAVWAPGFRDATIDDLRRACEAAGLTLASAQHAEDLEKLGREMAEVVAQRDEARKERDQYLQACENWRKLDAPLSEFRRVLRVGDYESTLDAARRMSREVEVCVGQLDHVMARAESARLEAYTLGRKSAEEQEAAWESERAELVAARDETDGNVRALKLRHVDVLGALGATIGETIEVAARRVVAERDAARERADKAEARSDALAAELAAIRAATGEDPTDEVLHAASMAVPQWTSYRAFRAVYNLGRDAARGEVARMREEVAAANAHAEPAYRTVKSIGEILSVEPDYEKVTDKVRDTANEVATLRDRVDGLEIDLNSAVQNSKANEVEANNLRSANRTLRDRVAELEAAPQGQPVATDEELRRVFADAEAPVRHSWAGFSAADRAGVAAVAALVRAERHACLVARAVALGCGVNLWSYEDGSKTNVRARVQVVDGNHTEEREVRPADVPATLARLLDEVEAARKAVSK